MKTFNEICAQLSVNPFEPSQDGLSKMLSYCRENVSQDKLFEGSYRDMFLKCRDYMQLYYDTFLRYKNPDDICSPISEFNNISTLEFLVNNGFNYSLNNLSPKPNEINSLFGLMTPLHLAAIHGYKKMTQDLIRLGAQQDTKNSKGEIPLHYALSFPFLYSKEFLNAKKEIFIRLYADRHDLILKPMEDGNTVIHLLALNGILDLLVQIVTENSDLISVKNHLGLLPVHTAVLNEQIDATEFLLKAANKPNDLLDFNKRTPLHHAVGVKNPSIIDLCIQAFSQNIDARDRNNRTPLMLAASYGNITAIKKLLAAGANPKLRDLNGKNSLQIAIAEQNIDVANCILEVEGMDRTLTHDDIDNLKKCRSINIFPR